jgi:3-hydroxyacyl-CoA dehydrogenase/enoyl-CoA hydratase/3-hydroxybutyryl-CoA epimerase
MSAGTASVDSAMRRVGVVGAGVMGSGIAQWLAACGLDVVLRDVEPAALARAREVIQGLFAEGVRRGKLTTAEADAGLRRVAFTPEWEAFGRCDLVIEAIVEDVAAKRRLFAELEAVVRPDALVASNTSALPLDEFMAGVSRPERTLGLHFFNPVSRMPLVELVVGAGTSAATRERARVFVQGLGKQLVECRSAPGFVVTRVLFFYLNEAVRLWEHGGGVEEIDGAMRAFGWPMGPLRLIDEVGVDVTDFIFGEMEHYFSGRFRRATATARLLAAGLRGRKNGTGRGFYRQEAGADVVNDGETRTLRAAASGSVPADVAAHLMRVMVAEAERCVAEGVVVSANDVDLALRLGAGFPAAKVGLLSWARAAAPA